MLEQDSLEQVVENNQLQQSIPQSNFTFTPIEDMFESPDMDRADAMMLDPGGVTNVRAAQEMINRYSIAPTTNIANPLPGSATTNFDPYSQSRPPEPGSFSEAKQIMQGDLSEGEINTSPIAFDVKSSNFKRYYEHPEYNNLGFVPYADMETYYNANSNIYDDLSRMSGELGTLGGAAFMSSYRTMADMMSGDWDSVFGGDEETSDAFEQAMMVGNSTRGGFGGFANNFFLNSAYTGGIIASIAVEELAMVLGTSALGLSTVPSAGTTLPATGTAAAATVARSGWNIFRGIKTIGQGIKNSFYADKFLKRLKDISSARGFWESATNGGKLLGNAFTPNTLFAIKNLNTTKTVAQNSRNIANTSKLFGGFYRDLRAVNLAISEGRLEGGMVANNLVNSEVTKREARGENVTDADMQDILSKSHKAAFETMMINAPIIYASNWFVLGNALGGFRRTLGMTVREGYESLGRRILRNKKTINPKTGKPSIGKVLTDRGTGLGAWWNGVKAGGARGSAGLIGGASLRYFANNIAEGVQELSQEAVSAATTGYYSALLDDPLSGGWDLRKANIKAGMGEQLSGQGFEVFMSGFLMGGFVQGPQKLLFQGIPSLYKYGGSQLGLKGAATEKQKAAFQEFRDAKEKTVQTALDALNTTWDNQSNDPFSVFGENMMNYAFQKQINNDLRMQEDLYNITNRQDEARFKNAHTIFETGTSHLFIEQLQDFMKADDKTLYEMGIGFTPTEIKNGKARARLQDQIDNIGRMQKDYNDVRDEFPNLFNPAQYPPDSEDYKRAALSSRAWDHSRMLLMFTKNSMVRAAERASSINSRLQNEPLFKNMSAGDLTVLTSKESLVKEMQILTDEIDLLKAAEQTPKIKKELAFSSKKLELLAKFFTTVINPKNRTNNGKGAFDRRKMSTIEKPFQAYVQFLASQSKEDGLTQTFVDPTEVRKALTDIIDYGYLDGNIGIYNRALLYLMKPENFAEIFNRTLSVVEDRFENNEAITKKNLEKYIDIQLANKLINELMSQEDVVADAEESAEFLQTGDSSVLKNFFTAYGQINATNDKEKWLKIQSIISTYNQMIKKDESVSSSPVEKVEVSEVTNEQQEEILSDAGVDVVLKQPNNTPMLNTLLDRSYNKYAALASTQGEVVLSYNDWRSTDEAKLIQTTFNNIKRVWAQGYDSVDAEGIPYKITVSEQQVTDEQGFTEFLLTREAIESPVIQRLLSEVGLTLSDIIVDSDGIAAPVVELSRNEKPYAQGTNVDIVEVNPGDESYFELRDKNNNPLKEDVLSILPKVNQGIMGGIYNTGARANDALNYLEAQLPDDSLYDFDGLTIHLGETVIDNNLEEWLVKSTPNMVFNKGRVLLRKKEDNDKNPLEVEPMKSVGLGNFRSEYNVQSRDVEALSDDFAKLNYGKLVQIYPRIFDNEQSLTGKWEQAQRRLAVILSSLTDKQIQELVLVIERDPNGGNIKGSYVIPTNPTLKKANPQLIEGVSAYKIGFALPAGLLNNVNALLEKENLGALELGEVFGYIDNGNYAIKPTQQSKGIDPTNINIRQVKNIINNASIPEGMQDAQLVENVQDMFATNNLLASEAEILLGDNALILIPFNAVDAKGDRIIKFDLTTFLTGSIIDFDNIPKPVSELEYQFVNEEGETLILDVKRDGNNNFKSINEITSFENDEANERRRKLDDIQSGLESQQIYDSKIKTGSDRYYLIVKAPNGQYGFATLQAKKLTSNEFSKLAFDLIDQAQETQANNKGKTKEQTKTSTFNVDFNKNTAKDIFIKSNKRNYKISIQVNPYGEIQMQLFNTKTFKDVTSKPVILTRDEVNDEGISVEAKLVTLISKFNENEEVKPLGVVISPAKFSQGFPEGATYSEILSKTTTGTATNVFKGQKVVLNANSAGVAASRGVADAANASLQETVIEDQVETEVNPNQKYEDAVADIDQQISDLRSEDGSILPKDTKKFKALQAKRVKAISDANRGNSDGTMAIRVEDVNGGFSTVLVGEEAIQAENDIENYIATIEKSVISGKITKEKGRDMIMRYVGVQGNYNFLMNEIDSMDRYVRDRLDPNIPEVGNNKSKFTDWRKGNKTGAQTQKNESKQTVSAGPQSLTSNEAENSVLDISEAEYIIMIASGIVPVAFLDQVAETKRRGNTLSVREQGIYNINSEIIEMKIATASIEAVEVTQDNISNQIEELKITLLEGVTPRDHFKTLQKNEEYQKLLKERDRKDKGLTNKILDGTYTPAFDELDIVNINDFMMEAQRILPDFITIDDIAVLGDNMKAGGVRVGAFQMSLNNLAGGLNVKGTIYTGAQNPFKYHEAFHAVYRLLLTPEQQKKLQSVARKEVRAKLRAEGKSLEKELQKFKNSANTYSDMSREQLEKLYYEEYMSDEFDKFKINPKSTDTNTEIKSLFNRIIEFIKAFIDRFTTSQLQRTFEDIDAGKYKNASVASNEFTESVLNDGPIIANALVPFKKIVVNQIEGFQYLDGNIADMIVRGIAATYLARSAKAELPYNPKDIFDSVVDDYQWLYSPNNSINDLKSEEQKEKLKAIESAFLNYSTLIIEQADNLIEIITDKSVIQEAEIDNIEDSVGVRTVSQYDLDASLIGGLKAIPSDVRKYIALTSVAEKDFFGNEYLSEGEKIIVPVDFVDAFNSILKSTSNITNPLDFLKSMYFFGEDNVQGGAIVRKLLQDVGYSAESLLIDESFPEEIQNSSLLQSFINGFTNVRIDYLFTERSLSGDIRIYTASQKDDINSQLTRWQQAYYTAKKKLRSDPKRSEDTIKQIRDFDAALKATNEMTDKSLDKMSKAYSQDLYENVGIKLSSLFIKVSLLQNRNGKTKKQEALKKLYSQSKTIQETGQQSDFSTMSLLSSQLAEDIDIFDEKLGMLGRLRELSIANAPFDETVGATIHRNSNGDLVYAHQKPTYNLWFVNNLNNQEFFNEQKEDPYKAQNFLLNSSAFKKMSGNREITVLRMEGSKVTNQLIDNTLEDGVSIDNTDFFRTQTYGNFTNKEFSLTQLNLYTAFFNTKSGRVDTIVDDLGNVSAIAPIFPKVMEASNTAELIGLPVIKTVSGSNAIITEETLDLFLDNIKNEFARINRESNIDTSTETVLGYNDKKGRGFTFFNNTTLLSQQFKDELSKVAYDQGQSGNIISFDDAVKFTPYTLNEIKQDLSTELNNEFDQYFNYLNNEGVYDEMSIKIKDGLNVQGENTQNTNVSSELLNLIPTNTRYNLRQIFFNQKLNASAFNELQHGDQAMLFKSSADRTKRAKGNNNAGTPAYSLVIAPEKGIFHTTEDISFLLFDEPKSLDGSIDIADAEGYTTVKGARHLKFGTDSLSTGQAELFDAMELGISDAYQSSVYFGSEEKPIGLVQSKSMVNAKKYAYFDGESYKKFTVTTLFKEYTSNLNPETQVWEAKPGMSVLHNLRLAMEKIDASKDTITIAGPLSASKAKKMRIVPLSDIQDNIGALEVLPHTTLSAKHMRLQQITPSNQLEGPDPTQIGELITNVPVQFHKTKVPGLRDLNGDALDLGQIITAYNEVKTKKFKLSFNNKRNLIFAFESAVNDFNISNNTNITPKLAAFLKFAEKSLKAGKTSTNLLDFFSTTDGKQNYNLNNSITVTKFEQLFLNYFTKGVFSQKVPMVKLTLISPFGVQKYRRVYDVKIVNGETIPTRSEIVRDKVFDRLSLKVEKDLQDLTPGKIPAKGYIVLDRLRLVPLYTNPKNVNSYTGETVMEMQMPAHHSTVRDLIENTNAPIPNVIAKQFAVRIPTDDFHSAIPSMLVDFMPTAMGSVGMYAEELIEIAGSDHDGDKTFAHIKDFYIKDGKFKEYGKTQNKREEYLEYIRYSNRLVKAKGSQLQSVFELYSDNELDARIDSSPDSAVIDIATDPIDKQGGGMLLDTAKALAVLGLPISPAQYSDHKIKYGYPFEAPYNNKLLDYKFALVGNESMTTGNNPISYTPTSEEPINAALELLEEQEQRSGETSVQVAAQQTSEIKSENISSKGSEFAKKLTNPGNNLKVTYKGRDFRNAEHAYQTYKSGEFDQKAYDSNAFKPVGSKPANRNTNYQTMVDILKAKLKQHPELIEGISQKGGLAYIEGSTHNVTGDKFWESKGQNKFIEALADAYRSTQPTQQTSEYANKLKLISERKAMATKSDLENSQLIKDIRVDKTQPKELKPNAADNKLAAIMLYGKTYDTLIEEGLPEEANEAKTLAYRILNDLMFDINEIEEYMDVMTPEYAGVLTTNENPVKEFFENDIFEQADKQPTQQTNEVANNYFRDKRADTPYDPSSFLGQAIAFQDNKGASIGASVLPNLYLSNLVEAGSKINDKKFTPIIDGITYNNFDPGSVNQAKINQDGKAAIVSMTVDNPTNRFVGKAGFNRHATTLAMNMLSLGMPMETIILLINTPIIRKIYKEASESNYSSFAVKKAISKSFAIILQTFDDTKPIVPKLNSKLMLDYIREDYNGRVNPQDWYDVDLSILREFAKASRLQEFTNDMVAITSLTKGVGKSMQNIAKRKKQIKNLFDSKAPIDLTKVFGPNTWHGAFIKGFELLSDQLLPATFLRSSEGFQEMLSLISNQMDLTNQATSEETLDKISLDLLSYLTIKGYRNNMMKNDSHLVGGLTNNILYPSEEESIVDIVNKLKETPEGTNNDFLDGFLILTDSRNSKSGLNLAEANTFRVMNSLMKIDLQNGFSELYGSPNTRLDAMNIVSYMMVKDGLQLGYGTLLDAINPYILNKFLSHVNTVNDALRGKQDMETVFGEDIRTLINNFIKGYTLSAASNKRVFNLDSSNAGISVEITPEGNQIINVDWSEYYEDQGITQEKDQDGYRKGPRLYSFNFVSGDSVNRVVSNNQWDVQDIQKEEVVSYSIQSTNGSPLQNGIGFMFGDLISTNQLNEYRNQNRGSVARSVDDFIGEGLTKEDFDEYTPGGAGLVSSYEKEIKERALKQQNSNITAVQGTRMESSGIKVKLDPEAEETNLEDTAKLAEQISANSEAVEEDERQAYTIEDVDTSNPAMDEVQTSLFNELKLSLEELFPQLYNFWTDTINPSAENRKLMRAQGAGTFKKFIGKFNDKKLKYENEQEYIDDVKKCILKK